MEDERSEQIYRKVSFYFCIFFCASWAILIDAALLGSNVFTTFLTVSRDT
jgi:hypothetical protein